MSMDELGGGFEAFKDELDGESDEDFEDDFEDFDDEEFEDDFNESDEIDMQLDDEMIDDDLDEELQNELDIFENDEQIEELASEEMDEELENEILDDAIFDESLDVDDGIEMFTSRNEEMEGMEHPVTGVEFKRQVVEIGDRKIEVVAPEFDSKFETKLDKEFLTVSDREQFSKCNENLKNQISENKALEKMFDSDQLEQIKNGDTPDGYTWHHDVFEGKMQLVETDIHQKTGHTGGRSIWGGGSDHR